MIKEDVVIKDVDVCHQITWYLCFPALRRFLRAVIVMAMHRSKYFTGCAAEPHNIPASLISSSERCLCFMSALVVSTYLSAVGGLAHGIDRRQLLLDRFPDSSLRWCRYLVPRFQRYIGTTRSVVSTTFASGQATFKLQPCRVLRVEAAGAHEPLACLGLGMAGKGVQHGSRGLFMATGAMACRPMAQQGRPARRARRTTKEHDGTRTASEAVVTPKLAVRSGGGICS